MSYITKHCNSTFYGGITYVYCSVQWVCPRQSSTSDIVLDDTQSSAGQLVGVGREGDVRWWKVREEEEEEGEGGGEGGEPLNVEVLAVLKKAELSSQLGRFGYGKKLWCTKDCFQCIFENVLEHFFHCANA